MTTIPLAWKQARATRAVRRHTPMLLLFVAWLARTLPAWKRARTAVMQWAAFGAIDAGLFGWHWIAGAIGVGVSLLVLEALGGERA
jgi:divalent metal cation (Fe/Co/Zn/Cd) transporter